MLRNARFGTAILFDSKDAMGGFDSRAPRAGGRERSPRGLGLAAGDHWSRPLNRIHPPRPLNRTILPCQNGYYNSNVKVLSIVVKVVKKLRYS